jgi:hypothetical protein
MSINRYQPGASFAKSLIAAGKINARGSWDFSADDGNKLLGSDGDNWDNYAKHRLAVDTDGAPETEDRYRYPFAKMIGDDSQIYRKGVIAAKSKATQQGQDTIAAAADTLLQAINKKLGLDEKDDNIDAEIPDNWQDGDNDPPHIKKAKNAVNNALRDGKIKKPDKCDKCGSTDALSAHHHKGYDKKHWLDVQWLCRDCHNAADKKMRDKKKKKDTTYKPAYRIDRIDAPLWMTERFVQNGEGFLQGQAVVTNVGVFTYRDVNGDIRRELRLPEDVFDGESLHSLLLKPLTNDHPPEMINGTNVHDHQVGNLGSRYAVDGYHVSIDMAIMEPEAINDVMAGKRALSCGYSADLEESTGMWMGIPYDAIQRNIRYNHVAIVDAARAGDAARIRLDANSALLVSDNQIEKEADMALKKIKLDGVDYEAEAEVIKTLNQHKERADKFDSLLKDFAKLKEDSTVVEAERDTLKERVDQLDKDLKELKESHMDESAIQEKVKVRLRILDAAAKAEVEYKEDGNNIDIMKAVIMKVFPDAKLDERDEVYITARFDGAVELLIKLPDAEKRKAVFSGNLDNANEEEEGKIPDSAKSRQNMMDSLQKRSRGEKEGGSK